MKGLVIKNTGSWYQVKTDDGQFIECKIKGNFRLKGIRSTNPVAVGDRVQIILNQEGTAFINEIEDRKNYIIRRSSNLSKQSHILAANLDQCMLVVTVNYPETSTIFIDRFLASAEAYRVPVKLVFNKMLITRMSSVIWTLLLICIRISVILVSRFLPRKEPEWMPSKKTWKARSHFSPVIRELENRRSSTPFYREPK
jgi:putative ribosome biogenesis GTPase RsgA